MNNSSKKDQFIEILYSCQVIQIYDNEGHDSTIIILDKRWTIIHTIWVPGFFEGMGVLFKKKLTSNMETDIFLFC